MFLAHGPLGYSIGYLLSKRFQFPRWQLWLAAAGGVFPDVDLFYYYLVDSSVSHHQYLTHSLLPYLLVILLAWWIKPLRWPVTLFALGSISHVLVDMLTGFVAIWNPLSDHMVGVPTWSYSQTMNLLAELVIIWLAIGTAVRQRRRWLLIGLISGLIIGSAFIWLNRHSYKPAGAMYYRDQDGDGLMNVYDRDLDGDGLRNIIDTDIDNNGTDNSLEMYLELFSTAGALFDYSFGHAIEVPLRLGLVNDVALLQRVFANVGIFLEAEMTYDYAAQPAGYTYTPTDNEFMQSSNLLNWIKHTERVLPANAPRQEFDVLFFASGQIAIFTRVDGADVVLDVHPSHPFTEYRSLEQVSQREGGIMVIGRILPKPFQKRY